MFQRKISERFALIMALLLVISAAAMTGCSDKPAEEPKAAGVSVNSPVEISCLTTNPVDVAIEDVADENNTDFSCAKVTVTGLADESVQEKVNSTISETIAAMKGAAPPPYRGAKAKLGENPDITGEWISAYTAMNANNILSMYIVRSITYTDYCMSDIQTLNFDLNTGTQIALKDIFCDDVDYIAYTSDYVSKQLLEANADEEGYYEGSLGMTQTEPYHGISENQKFYLDQYTGNLALIFDYETPEVETNWYYVSMLIPFDDNGAYSKRFMTGKNIYTYDGPEQKQLFSVNLPFDCVNEVAADQPRKNMYVYSSVRYSSEMPKELQQLADGFGKIEGEKQDFVAEKYDEYAAKYGEDSIWGNYETRVYAGRISEYWYIGENLYMCVSNNDGDADETFATSVGHYHTYKDGSADELTLYDVFNKDANVEKLVKTAMRTQMEMSEELEDVDIKQDLLDTLYDNINGFYLSNDSLYVSYGDLNGILKDYGIGDDEAYNYFGSVESLLYKNIGCENLVIFD